MRLPVLDGNDSRIDKKETFRMVDEAMAKGINYYDTAWGYHGENSEIVMGEALAKYPRDSFYLATKFPGYDVSILILFFLNFKYTEYLKGRLHVSFDSFKLFHEYVFQHQLVTCLEKDYLDQHPVL